MRVTLLPVTKTAWGGGLIEVARPVGELVTKVTGFQQSADISNTVLQCSRSRATTSKNSVAPFAPSSPANPVTSGWPPVALAAPYRVDPTIVARIRRSGRAERGSCTQPSFGANDLHRRDTNSVSYEKAPRFPKEKGGQVSGKGRVGTGERTRELQGKRLVSLYSPVGFRHL